MSDFVLQANDSNLPHVRSDLVAFVNESFSTASSLYGGSQGDTQAELDDIGFALCDSLDAVGKNVFFESVEENKSIVSFTCNETEQTMHIALSFLEDQFEILLGFAPTQKTH